jgi:hypothetical protein
MCLYSLYLSSGLFRLMHGSFGYFVKKKKKKKKKRERAHVAQTKSHLTIVDGIDVCGPTEHNSKQSPGRGGTI